MDPLQGWTYNAKPLPALDTYTRHTVAAQYLYAILGPSGLRLLTPTVVWVELLAAPLAFLGSYLGSPGLVKFAVAMIVQLHFGVSFTIRNSFLLSYVACAAWFVFLPLGWERQSAPPSRKSPTTPMRKAGTLVSAVLVGSLISANVWFETNPDCTTSSLKSIWSTVLQNRWNVFIGTL
jgi:predicted neutral ceramidase superfamily lipid hydrolase